MKNLLKFSNLLKTLGLLILISGMINFSSCSSGNESAEQGDASDETKNEALFEDDGKGVGPVKEVTIAAAIDSKMADEGKALFDSKCTACHKFSAEKYVGPGLKGVTTRRKPEWIMNMILDPAGMTAKDPTAKELLATHLTQMTNQNVTQDDARKILEYFRQQDGAGSSAAN